MAVVRVLVDESSTMRAVTLHGATALDADRPRDVVRTAFRLLAALAALLITNVGANAAEEDRVPSAGRPIAFHIPAQSLAGALQAYGQATGIQVLYESNSAVGRMSVAVEGTYAADEALSLLLTGTELRVRYIRPDAITLALPSAEGVRYAPPAAPLAASDLSLGRLRVRRNGDADEAARLQDYSQGVQMDIQNALRKNAKTRDGNYRAVLDIWIDPARTIEHTELFRSTGDHERDVAVSAALRGLTISKPAPANTPQPVRVVIVVKSLQ
ncbi:STN domain-containing protein [Bradyrhizobium japonicum]|uniref:STN domain-containing protein n=1 Tax=Bradyrhizobium japonicum TaxID=375 RepID=UPI0020110F3B|nr:STN domain-containing protein [Bradyrhizobium japonicum]